MLPRWWVVFRVVTGKLIYYWALCPRFAETRRGAGMYVLSSNCVCVGGGPAISKIIT